MKFILDKRTFPWRAHPTVGLLRPAKAWWCLACLEAHMEMMGECCKVRTSISWSSTGQTLTVSRSREGKKKRRTEKEVERIATRWRMRSGMN